MEVLQCLYLNGYVEAAYWWSRVRKDWTDYYKEVTREDRTPTRQKQLFDQMLASDGSVNLKNFLWYHRYWSPESFRGLVELTGNIRIPSDLTTFLEYLRNLDLVLHTPYFGIDCSTTGGWHGDIQLIYQSLQELYQTTNNLNRFRLLGCYCYRLYSITLKNFCAEPPLDWEPLLLCYSPEQILSTAAPYSRVVESLVPYHQTLFLHPHIKTRQVLRALVGTSVSPFHWPADLIFDSELSCPNIVYAWIDAARKLDKERLKRQLTLKASSVDFTSPLMKHLRHGLDRKTITFLAKHLFGLENARILEPAFRPFVKGGLKFFAVDTTKRIIRAWMNYMLGKTGEYAFYLVRKEARWKGAIDYLIEANDQRGFHALRLLLLAADEDTNQPNLRKQVLAYYREASLGREDNLLVRRVKNWLLTTKKYL